jgi:hypothetical protein
MPSNRLTGRLIQVLGERGEQVVDVLQEREGATVNRTPKFGEATKARSQRLGEGAIPDVVIVAADPVAAKEWLGVAKQHHPGCPTIALTSPGDVDKIRELGFNDAVDEVPELVTAILRVAPESA